VISQNGSYFTPYQLNLKLIFHLSGLNGFVEGRVPKPEPVLLQLQVLANEACAGVLPPPVPVITNAVAINDWELTDCYAMFLIYNTCDATTQQLLLTCRTSFEMWTRLETQFLQRAADNMHLIHLEFMNKRPQDGHDIMVHVTALETLAAQLHDLGEPISDNTLMTTILCKLPPRFKWFTHAWQNLRDNERTLEAFRTRLISEQRSLDLEGAAQRSNIQDTTAIIPPTPIASAINGDANAALFGQCSLMVTKGTMVVTAVIKVDVIALTPTVKVQTDLKLSAAIVVNLIIIGLNASNALPTKA
jgi:hypothetical protein